METEQSPLPEFRIPGELLPQTVFVFVGSGDRIRMDPSVTDPEGRGLCEPIADPRPYDAGVEPIRVFEGPEMGVEPPSPTGVRVGTELPLARDGDPGADVVVCRESGVGDQRGESKSGECP